MPPRTQQPDGPAPRAVRVLRRVVPLVFLALGVALIASGAFLAATGDAGEGAALLALGAGTLAVAWAMGRSAEEAR